MATTLESIDLIEIPRPYTGQALSSMATRLVLSELGGNVNPTDEDVAAYCQKTNFQIVYAAVSSENIFFGSGAFSVFNEPVFGRIGFIADLVVDPVARNRGIASKLLSHLEAQARAYNPSEIFLHPTSGYEDFYIRRGYIEKDRPYADKTPYVKSLV